MNTSDRIDVLIPVYNGAAWLRESITSIREQDHAALHIHVVDDGSTDATPQILAELAQEEPRLRVHTQSNQGIVAALNHGLRHCDAAWIARHDADDLAYPQRLSEQLAYLRGHPDCVAVGAMARHIDGAGRPLGTVTVLRPPDEADPHWVPAREPYLMHPLLLVRRDALQAAGGYRGVLHAEDSDLYWRLRDHGRLHNLPQVLADYRVHGQSVSSASVRNGRLMALSSQLAALSARRRSAGQPDLCFARTQGRRLRAAADSLAMLTQDASARLTRAEAAWLELATAAKLLELASYQPYELGAGDVRHIGAVTRRGRLAAMAAPNRRLLSNELARAAARLCRAGRWVDALRLAPAACWPVVLLRLAWQALPDGGRRRLRALRTASDQPRQRRAAVGG